MVVPYTDPCMSGWEMIKAFYAAVNCWECCVLPTISAEALAWYFGVVGSGYRMTLVTSG